MAATDRLVHAALGRKADQPTVDVETVWLADITCSPTGQGWLHLAAVLDLATFLSGLA